MQSIYVFNPPFHAYLKVLAAEHRQLLVVVCRSRMCGLHNTGAMILQFVQPCLRVGSANKRSHRCRMMRLYHCRFDGDLTASRAELLRTRTRWWMVFGVVFEFGRILRAHIAVTTHCDGGQLSHVAVWEQREFVVQIVNHGILG